MPTIRVSDELFARLETYAKGFDTPASVIERLLDELEACSGKPTEPSDTAAKLQPAHRKELVFLPSEAEFRRQLLIHKRALVELEYTDGSTEEKVWNAARFTESSNLRGNLASGYLRNWAKRGIVKATFQVAHSDG